MLLRLYVCGYSVGLGSSVGIATTLRAERSSDRIPVGARFSATVQTGPWGYAPSYEGWNFNSGNYLFTTDTKQIHVSKFYCPSL